MLLPLLLGWCFYPLCCDTCCATNFVHMWQKEKPLEGVKPLIVGRCYCHLLVAPKDKDHITKKSGIIYRYKCDRLECNEEYIGESARTFGERYREHLKAPSPNLWHCNTTGHNSVLDNFSIVEREDHSLMRLIKEAIYIRVNNPSLNRNMGKYHLSPMWDEVLFNIKELKLKKNRHIDPEPIPSATLAISLPY